MGNTGLTRPRPEFHKLTSGTLTGVQGEAWRRVSALSYHRRVQPAHRPCCSVSGYGVACLATSSPLNLYLPLAPTFADPTAGILLPCPLVLTEQPGGSVTLGVIDPALQLDVSADAAPELLELAADVGKRLGSFAAAMEALA